MITLFFPYIDPLNDLSSHVLQVQPVILHQRDVAVVPNSHAATLPFDTYEDANNYICHFYKDRDAAKITSLQSEILSIDQQLANSLSRNDELAIALRNRLKSRREIAALDLKSAIDPQHQFYPLYTFRSGQRVQIDKA